MTNRNKRLSLNRNPGKRISRRISQRLNILWLLCVCFLCFSCENRAVYDQYQAIHDSAWEKDKEYYFTFRIQDASIPYEVTLEVRNTNLYPYQNLWVFCNEEQPIGPLLRDTMECKLADEYGKWYGHGISLYQSSFPVRSEYYFPIEGQYTFSFRQGMRNNRLTGIQEIGLRVYPSRLNAPSARRPSEEI